MYDVAHDPDAFIGWICMHYCCASRVMVRSISIENVDAKIYMYLSVDILLYMTSARLTSFWVRIERGE